MIAFLIDADNLNSPIWVEEAFRAIERRHGFIAIRRAYGSAENLKGLAETLRVLAIRPVLNLFLPKNTTDMALAIDAVELACTEPNLKLVAIGSGDLDFAPLAVRLREKGIKVLCATKKSKMSADAKPFFQEIFYVDVNSATIQDLPQSTAEIEELIPASKIAKKTTSAQIPAKQVKPKQIAQKKASPKPAPKTVARVQSASPSIEDILDAAPTLMSGEWQPLSAIAKQLHDKKILAKSASSTKLFKKFMKSFKLEPATKPNRVQFLPLPK
ncbi:MAG: NYN domain-containing protein [Burkholderiales bacterium]|nr:MAG: NYN domain-containing protein [Burkholderiales bacterium]